MGSLILFGCIIFIASTPFSGMAVDSKEYGWATMGILAALLGIGMILAGIISIQLGG